MRVAVAVALLLVAIHSAKAAMAPPPAGDPSQDTAALQQTLDTGGEVTVPRGIYRTDATLLVSSNTTVRCEPGSAFKPIGDGFAKGQLFVISNRKGAHDITVQDCTVDASDWPYKPGHHAFYFRDTSRIRLIRPHCPAGPGDCTAMVHTDNTLVEDGQASGILNACWDHWDSSTNMRVVGGSCSSSLYGVLMTGANSDTSDAGQSSGGSIERGSYTIDYPGLMRGRYKAASAGAAIWINGLGKPGSGTSHVTISGVEIHTSGDTTTAIRVSGAGTDVTIRNPIITGSSLNAAVIVNDDKGGRPKRTRISGAQFRDMRVGKNPLMLLGGDDDVADGLSIQGGQFSAPMKRRGQ